MILLDYSIIDRLWVVGCGWVVVVVVVPNTSPLWGRFSLSWKKRSIGGMNRGSNGIPSRGGPLHSLQATCWKQGAMIFSWSHWLWGIWSSLFFICESKQWDQQMSVLYTSEKALKNVSTRGERCQADDFFAHDVCNIKTEREKDPYPHKPWVARNMIFPPLLGDKTATRHAYCYCADADALTFLCSEVAFLWTLGESSLLICAWPFPDAGPVKTDQSDYWIQANQCNERRWKSNRGFAASSRSIMTWLMVSCMCMAMIMITNDIKGNAGLNPDMS